MTLKVIGAGVGRTGTMSLKIALERLLGAPCYHIVEVFQRPAHFARWSAAARGEPIDWHALLDGFAAAVDWPSSAFWPELAAANPDAIILLSTRDSASWWRSCDDTIFEVFRTADDKMPSEWTAMIKDLFRQFAGDTLDEQSAVAAYERHNAHVRATAPPERLLEWHPGDGWAPICAALGVDVPDETFPHVNSTAEFRAMAGLEG